MPSLLGLPILLYIVYIRVIWGGMMIRLVYTLYARLHSIILGLDGRVSYKLPKKRHQDVLFS